MPGFVHVGRGESTVENMELMKVWNMMLQEAAGPDGFDLEGSLRGVCRNLCPFAR